MVYCGVVHTHQFKLNSVYMMVSRMKQISLVVVLLASTGFSSLSAQPRIPSPDGYLGYELGEQFTPHHQVLGYFRAVAEASPLVTYEKYGETNEGRELGIVKVSSESNHQQLEQIRTDNLKRTGLMEGAVQGGPVPIVWLSYNVHGNESSSSEAAMKTLYELVRPGRSDTKAWLDKTVVIMDPMLNPDGRDRYVHWYKQTVGEQYNARPAAREHHEPWPGGRTNHYYFDLNRDWAWLTQKESRARIGVYQQWMPQIHVDFHEQGYNEPYYFAPAAKPFHQAITEWQEQFQYTIGRNHADYFDANNWLYFTREVFDLFYPSYGDTYPIFNGAIGMTYEQGGSGRAGLGIIKAEGDTLTLRDRLMHHHTTGLSTIEVTAGHAAEVITEFEQYYQGAQRNPSGAYKSYVLRADSSAPLRALLELLDHHKIRYGRLREGGRYEAFSYRQNGRRQVELRSGDIVVSAYQPKSVLARVLFEPKPVLTDSLTYDITAWALPYAYGVEAYAVEERLEARSVNDSMPAPDPASGQPSGGQPYAYLSDWDDPSDVAFLAQLLKHKVQVRVTSAPFTLEGREYEAGTLVITRSGNTAMGEAFDDIVQAAADWHGQELQRAETGFVSAGPDFGSSGVALIGAPRVGLLAGAGTSSNRVGEVWHYFDRQIGYPITLLDTGYFSGVNLADYDVLILPAGRYGDRLSDERMGEIRAWVRGGGTLIALGGANELLAGREGFALKEKTASGSASAADSAQPDPLRTYGQRQRAQAPTFNPGSIYEITMDPTHPLGYGYGDSYFSLKLDTDAYAFLEDGWNVGAAREGAHVSGFTGYKVKEELSNTLAFGVEQMGRGSVVYMVDNPLFRAFWYSGKLLFGNAVFMVGN